MFGSIVWPLVTSNRLEIWPVVIWGTGLGAMYLVVCWLLLVSKQFASEFAYLQETQPAYKRTLRRIALAVIVVAVLVATANDVYYLTML